MVENWKTYKLNEIAKVIDSLHKTPKYSETGYPMVRVTDVKQGFLNLENTFKVSETVYKEFSKKYKPICGDIIMTRVGTYGSCSFVKTKEEFCLGQNTVVIVPEIENEFLYYSMISPLIKKQIEAQVTGSTQKTISLKNIRALELIVPNAKEQKAIASILSALDDKIELNLQMNKTLEEMAMALYKHWFVDFGPFQNGKFIPSELGDIPEGWEVKTLGEIISNKRINKAADKIADDEKYLGLEHIAKGSLSILKNGIGSDVSSNKSSFLKGDILFGKLRPYFKKVGVAPFDGICSTDILVIEPISKVDFAYALFTIYNDKFIDYTTTVSGGTRMPRVGWNAIKDYKVAIQKSKKHAEEFNDIVEPYIEQILANVEENQTLTKTRDTLLPKLISGVIRVKDIEKIIAPIL